MQVKNNLQSVLDKGTKKEGANVTITIRNEKNEMLVNQVMKLSEFKGGIKTFAKITNNITLRWYDEPLNITIDTIELKFKGGKFASNTKKIVNCYLNSQTLYKTENVLEIRRELRNNVYSFLNSKCDNILQVVELIKYIEKTPIKLLAQTICNTNFLLESNE